MNWFYWALGSAVFAALTAILAKVGVKDANPNLATAIRTTVILLFTWGIVFFTQGAAQLGTLGKKSWLFLVLSGLATGASWICYFHALQLGDASRVAPVDKLSLVFVLILAALFLKEKLSLQDYCGIALMLGGLLLLTGKKFF
ncbi:MAG: EamA family transporter [Verrucomicrobiales bacterium]|jgi:transporter family protein|nr:EamA family transporter [Verrucomicrobiales bacterium]